MPLNGRYGNIPAIRQVHLEPELGPSRIKRSFPSSRGRAMCAQSDRLTAFAETLRSRAKTTCFPIRREHLLVLAYLTEHEAELVKQSYDRLAASKDLIARVEIFLHHVRLRR